MKKLYEYLNTDNFIPSFYYTAANMFYVSYLLEKHNPSLLEWDRDVSEAYLRSLFNPDNNKFYSKWEEICVKYFFFNLIKDDFKRAENFSRNTGFSMGSVVLQGVYKTLGISFKQKIDNETLYLNRTLWIEHAPKILSKLTVEQRLFLSNHGYTLVLPTIIKEMRYNETPLEQLRNNLFKERTIKPYNVQNINAHTSKIVPQETLFNKIINSFKNILTQNSDIIIIPILLSVGGLTYFMYEYQVFDYFTFNFFKKSDSNIKNILLKENDIISTVTENNTKIDKNKTSYFIFGVLCYGAILIILKTLKE